MASGKKWWQGPAKYDEGDGMTCDRQAYQWLAAQGYDPEALADFAGAHEDRYPDFVPFGGMGGAFWLYMVHQPASPDEPQGPCTCQPCKLAERVLSDFSKIIK